MNIFGKRKRISGALPAKKPNRFRIGVVATRKRGRGLNGEKWTR
jgi:hypothetical protein